MLHIMKPESKAQKRANARNQLFRQIHGYSLTAFLRRAVNEQAITAEEYTIIIDIEDKLKYLKDKQFENSKILGFNPRRRCCLCNGIGRWYNHVTKCYYCNKCKSRYNDETNFININPNG